MVCSKICNREGVRQLRENFFNFIQISPGNERFKHGNYVRVLTSQDEYFPRLCFQISFLVFRTLYKWISKFLKLLRQHFFKDRHVYLISDRNKGILSATQNQTLWQPPFAINGICLRHIWANFTKTFKNRELKNLINEHSSMMLGTVGHMHGMMTTNISEHFNIVLKKARIELKSRDHIVTTYNLQEVMCMVKSLIRPVGTGNNVYTLKMNEKSCSCGKWQEYILPCSHVLAVCRENGIIPDAYVPDIYSRKTYKRTYQSNFNPVVHEDFRRDAPYNLTLCPLNINNQRTRKQDTRFPGKWVIEIWISPKM
ncbi:hypothetical protein M9H77_15987 [Catharanthus roseus]|uniref:Uncharacterized protein n=1 Tax=Catharanthus roseus TaxID=4058 RepID=A0ACC0B0L7_CATRO|nr:hypothetical protein M9H77_15987 [Catharanthus roseus]